MSTSRFCALLSLRRTHVGNDILSRKTPIRTRGCRIKAVAALLAGLYLGALTAHAQNAVWRGTGMVSDWNTPGNWSTGVVPTGQANFGMNPGGNRGPITFSLLETTSIGTLVFNAPDYIFELDRKPQTVGSLGHQLTITGLGIQVPIPANAPTFNVINLGRFLFRGTSTAGNARITLGIEGEDSGGFIRFLRQSMAGNATIVANRGSNIEFHDSSKAETATLTANSDGAIFFNESSSADHANITVDPGGELGFSPVFPGPDGGVGLNGGTSTAGNATIINNGTTNFFEGSRGGNATITTNHGGMTSFFGTSTGGNAAFITNAGGIVDISGLGTFPDFIEHQPPTKDVPGMTAGSIAGAGTYQLGSKELTVGSNNMDTTVSGLIEDGGKTGGSGGSLIKVGTGTLTLLGDNTYSGGTTIQEGTIAVGNLPGSQNEALGISTALGKGDVSLQGGTLRTTSLETGKPLEINVGRNYTQGPDGTLALGIGARPPALFDHVGVGGNASLAGTLVVSSLDKFSPVDGDAFLVLHTGGTILNESKFSSIQDQQFNTNNLQRVDIYTENGVVISYLAPQEGRVPEPPGTEPPGPEEQPGTPETEKPSAAPPSVAEIVQVRLPPLDPEQPFPEDLLLRLLDPTAEQLTALFEIPFSGANIQRFNLDDRMTQIQRSIVPPPPAPAPYIGKGAEGKAPPPPTYQPGPCWGVWANGWGDFVNIDDTSLAKGYRFTTGGMSAGIDYRITDHLAVGLFGGYSHTWTDFRPGNADVDTGRGGLYATYFDPTGWWVNVGAWGGYNSYSTSRPALLGPANGSTDGYEVSTFGDAGYNVYCGNLTFGPIVSMQYTTAHVSGFTEHGSLVPLDIHADSEDSLRTDVGGQASYTWHVGNISVIPGLRLAWEHEFKYSNLPLTASAPTLGGATANFSGPNLGHDSLLINANVGIQITPRILATIGYDGQVARDHYSSHAVTGTFSFSF